MRRLTSKLGPILQLAIIVSTIMAAIIIGYDGRRVVQLLVLALPGLALLIITANSRFWTRLQIAVIWSWCMMFVIDGLAQAYFRWNYDAAPKSSMVLLALANANQRESFEYVDMYAPVLTWWILGIIAAGFALAIALRRVSSRSAIWPISQAHRTRAVFCASIAAVIVVVAYAVPAWRKLHPVPYWADWATKISATRATLLDREKARTSALSYAQSLSLTKADTRPSTVVLVISDSVNRDNLSLYGYGRSTTPELAKRQSLLGKNKLVVQNAWATQASTIPALREMFYFGQEDASAPLNVLAVARAAGYRTWWISNHDDIGIERMCADLADEKHMLNRQPGRSTASLDEVVLPSVEAALKHPAPLKFIVVQLLGAHPHYSYRYPEQQNPFLFKDDAVDELMRKNGRPDWVRYLRKSYDAAILYHDRVVSQLLDLTRNTPDTQSYRGWLYISDHAQEVGHETNRVGHSASTASGYRIPTVIWQSAPRISDEEPIEMRPYRADWTGWTLMTLLGIRWQGFDETRDVLSPSYKWVAPNLSAEITSFTDHAIAAKAKKTISAERPR